MPDYSVDIAIAVKGAKELKAARAETTKLSKEITTLNQLANKKSKTIPNSFKNLNKVLGQAKGNLNKVAIGTERYFRAIGDVIDKEERLNTAYSRQKVEFKAIQNLKKKGIQINKQNIQLIKNEIAAELKLAKAKKQTGKANIGKGLSGNIGGTISSAAIGGAFPLLFGQTGAAAIGGGIGGAAGGLIGGQFGFALSIVGTALGSASEKNLQFNQSLASLNARLSTVSDGSKLVAKDIDDLAKRFKVTKEEAFGLLEGFKEFDNPRIRKSLVEVFGSDSGAFQGLASSNRSAKLAKEIFEARKLIGDQQTTQLLQQNLINGAEVVELALIRAKIKARQRDQIEQAKQISIFGRIGAGFRLKTADEVIESRIKKLEKTFAETEDQTIKDTIEGLKIIREQIGLVNEAQGQFGESGVLAFSAITDKVKDLQDEMKRLQNPISQALSLSESMARSFEDSFVGIIKGTMSVGDAFRNMLNSMADHFIKTAARMAANQFQQGILGLLGGAFGGIGGGNLDKTFGAPMLAPVSGLKFADGGRPPIGRASLVGERGPELFVPDRAGTILPNNAMGSTNIVVNVDASGSSVEGDEERGREFGEQLVSAVQAVIINERRSGGLLN